MKKLQIILICLFAFTAINTNAQTQGAGYALNFDGIDDYVDCGNNPVLDRNDQDFTIETWININAVSNSWVESIVSNRTSNMNEGSHLFIRGGADGTNKNKVAFDTNRDADGTRMLFSNTRLLTDRWYHIAVVFEYNAGTSNNVCTIYIDGLVDGVSTTMADILLPNPVVSTKIGYEEPTQPEYHFDGNLDEVRIWNRALTETEIRNNMNKQLTGNEPGLVAYYRMNEGEDGTCEDGKDVCDKSGNGNHGTKN